MKNDKFSEKVQWEPYGKPMGSQTVTDGCPMGVEWDINGTSVKEMQNCKTANCRIAELQNCTFAHLHSFARIAAMLLMMLTLGIGEMWGAETIFYYNDNYTSGTKVNSHPITSNGITLNTTFSIDEGQMYSSESTKYSSVVFNASADNNYNVNYYEIASTTPISEIVVDIRYTGSTSTKEIGILAWEDEPSSTFREGNKYTIPGRSTKNTTPSDLQVTFTSDKIKYVRIYSKVKVSGNTVPSSNGTSWGGGSTLSLTAVKITTSSSTPSTKTVYLQSNDGFKGNNWSLYKLYYWTGSGDGWLNMENAGTCDGVFKTTQLPSDATGIIFVSKTAAGDNWDNKNAQTVNIESSDIVDGHLYTIGPKSGDNYTAPHDTYTPSYSVTFNRNGKGSSDPASQCVASGGKASAPTNPTANGYVVDGWYENAECTGSVWNFGTGTITADKELFAHWVEDLSTGWYLRGTFNNNGDSDTGWGEGGQKAFTKKTGESTGSVAYVDVALTAGQVFKFKLYHGSAWYGSQLIDEHETMASAKEMWSDNSSNATINAVAAGTYTFKIDYSGTYPSIQVTYPVQKYTVTYAANGGSGSMTDSNSPYNSGAQVTVLANAFTAPAGMMFAGYKNQDDETVAAGDKFTITKNTTLTAQWVVDPRKKILYVTTQTGSTLSADKLYTSLNENVNYNVTVASSIADGYASAYDLIVLHESLNGGDAASGNLKAVREANVPVLNTKAYFYNNANTNNQRWNWGTPDAGTTQHTMALNTDYTNISSHPIFAGVTISSNNITVTSGSISDSKNFQSITAFTSGKEGYTLAKNTDNECIIHELTPAQRGGAAATGGTAKYMMISLYSKNFGLITADGLKLFNNAVTYLLGNTQWEPAAPVAYTYSVNGSFDGWADHAVEVDGDVVINGLAKNTAYDFKVKKTPSVGEAVWCGATADDNSYTTSGAAWTLNGTYNVHMTTGAAGNYTFHLAMDGENPQISVTYPAAYSITYVGGDGATGSMASHTLIASGEEVTLTANAFEKTDYHFAGWKDQDENEIADGAQVTVTKDLTLTAQWVPAVTSVTVSAEGSVNTIMKGEYLQLTAECAPANALESDKAITWSSEDNNILTVNQEGLVHALAATAGTRIYATSANGKVGEYVIIVEASCDGKYMISLWNNETSRRVCFEQVGATTEWRADITLPEWSDNDKFWIGYEGWDGNSANWTTKQLTTVGLQSNNEATKYYPGLNSAGYLRIFSDHTSTKNYYVAFEPTYQALFGVMDSPTPWTVVDFHNTTGHEYETDLFEVPAGYKNNANLKYFVGTKRTNGTSQYIENKSRRDALNGMNILKDADYAGKYGKFHIHADWNDVNWYCEFIPYYTYVLKNDDESIFFLAPGVPSNAAEKGTTVHSAVPEKTGYTCIGWNHEKGATTTEIVGGGDYNYYTGNDTRYPVWQANKYNITYKDKDDAEFSGTGWESAQPTQHTYGTATDLVNPTKTGYTFNGWYTDQACETGLVTTLAADGYTANITLYAKWTAKTYTLSYKDQGNVAYSGSNLAALPTSHTYGIPTTLVDGVRDGHTFLGWYGGSDCTGTVWTVINSEREISGNTTFYAKWQKNAEAPIVTWTITGMQSSKVWAGGIYSLTVTTTSDAEVTAACLTKTSGDGELSNVEVNDKTITATLTIPANATVAPTLSLHTAATANYTESTETKDDITLGECTGGGEETIYEMHLTSQTTAEVIGGSVGTLSMNSTTSKIGDNTYYKFNQSALVKLIPTHGFMRGDVVAFSITGGQEKTDCGYVIYDADGETILVKESAFNITTSAQTIEYILPSDKASISLGRNNDKECGNGDKLQFYGATVTRATDPQGMQTPNLDWDAPATVETTLGDEDFTYAASSDNCAGEVTYTSSDETVATVADDGTVTILKAGTTTITATIAKDGYGCFEEKSISYTLEVAARNLIIEAGVTYTIQNGQTEKYTSITVSPNAELVVENGGRLNVTQELVFMYNNEGQVGVAKIDGEVHATNTYLDMHITSAAWHSVSLPSDVHTDNVIVDREDHKFYNAWYLRAFDGEEFSNYGPDTNSKGGKLGWYNVKSATTMNAKTGYLVGLGHSDSEIHILRFPITLGNQKEDKNGAINLTSPTGTLGDRYKGWNYVGIPYVSGYKQEEYGHYNLEIVTYSLINSNTNYRQVWLGDITLKPFTGYFFQVGADLAMDFVEGNRSLINQPVVAPVAARVATNNTEMPSRVSLILSNESGEKDETSLALGDEFTTNYEFGREIVKMFGEGYTKYSEPAVYTKSQIGDMAISALPYSAAQMIPVGFYAAADGTYTFSLNEKRDMSGLQAVWLTDTETGFVTNLLLSNYEFQTSRQANNNDRFYLSIVKKAPTITTGVENDNDNDNDKVEKVIINEALYIIRDGRMYNVQGKVIK